MLRPTAGPRRWSAALKAGGRYDGRMIRVATSLLALVALGAVGLGAEELSVVRVWDSLPRGHLVPRIEGASSALLGTKYRLSPLGEAQGRDPDPRFRLDAFDCTTYIETVLAFALASSPREVESLLDGLRYENGTVDFALRHHLPESQWIPALQEKGLLRDVTQEIGGKEAQSLTIVLNRDRWEERRRARGLQLSAERIPEGEFEVPFLPIARAVEFLEVAEDALVLNVVRELEDGSPIVVTHQALFFPRSQSQDARVRHASSVHGRVVEMSLSRFVTGQAMARKWPVVGLNVQRWQQPVD